MAELFTELRRILQEFVGNSGLDLTIETEFNDIPGWDSMDLISMAVEVECRFALQFELHEIDRLVTLGDLLHLTATKQACVSV